MYPDMIMSLPHPGIDVPDIWSQDAYMLALDAKDRAEQDPGSTRTETFHKAYRLVDTSDSPDDVKKQAKLMLHYTWAQDRQDLGIPPHEARPLPKPDFIDPTRAVRANNARARFVGVEASLDSSLYTLWMHTWNLKCAYCQTGRQDVIEHVVPIPPGPTSIYNVVPACYSCNTLKKGKDVVEWRDDEALADFLKRCLEAHEGLTEAMTKGPITGLSFYLDRA